MSLRRHRGFVVVLVAIAAAAGEVDAQTARESDSLFADDAPLTLRIAAPFQAMTGTTDRDEHDGFVTIPDTSADTQLPVEIRVRGRSRLANCDFPPLSLEFDKDAVAGTEFAGQHRLKLVTLCKREDSYRDYLTLEFLIYKFFNALTNRSFRVRWVNAEFVYTDTRRPRSVIEHAFLIEDDGEVAARLGMQIVERENFSIDELDPAHTALLTMFQFMIGNTDWSVLDGDSSEPCCHNGKVVSQEGGPIIVLPYDFDQSGLIATEYAVPSEKLPIRSVSQRLYRGFCVLNYGVDAAIARLNENRGTFGVGHEDKFMRLRALERAVEYLDNSYKVVNDRDKRQDQIYEECRA